MKKSKLFSLNFKDLAKGLIISALGGAINVVTDTLNAGSLHFDGKIITHTAFITGVAYLTKNFFTNSKDLFAQKEF